MSKRSYIKCVRDGMKPASWCGNDVHLGEFYFVTIDHAAESGRRKDRLMVCNKCRKSIGDALANGWRRKS